MAFLRQNGCFGESCSSRSDSTISETRSHPKNDWTFPNLIVDRLVLSELHISPSPSFEIVLVWVGYARNERNPRKQVWLHRVCRGGSLSLESFPQWAAGKLSKTILLWMQMNPFELHFRYVGVYGCQSPLRFRDSSKYCSVSDFTFCCLDAAMLWKDFVL